MYVEDFNFRNCYLNGFDTFDPGDLDLWPSDPKLIGFLCCTDKAICHLFFEKGGGTKICFQLFTKNLMSNNCLLANNIKLETFTNNTLCTAMQENKTKLISWGCSNNKFHDHQEHEKFSCTKIPICNYITKATECRIW